MEARLKTLEIQFINSQFSYRQDKQNNRRNQIHNDAEIQDRLLELEVLVDQLKDTIKEQKEEIAELKKNLGEELGFSKEYLNKW